MVDYNDILICFDSNLELLEIDIEDPIDKAERGIQYSKETLERLRTIVINSGFEDQKSEISFFKIVKPHVCSKLLYYIKLFGIEMKRPRNGAKSQIKYLSSQVEKLEIFFNDNLEFYNYYRRGATYLDEQYFLRDKSNIRLLPNIIHYVEDKEFSTIHDSTVSTIMAYDMLVIYLNKEIYKLKDIKSTKHLSRPSKPLSILTWTNSKTDLIELIYALDSSGAINNGSADIKEVASIVSSP